MRSGPIITAAALWTGGLAVTFALDDPRLRYPAFLVGYALAVVGWLGLVHLARRGRLDRRALAVVVLLAVGARLIALALTPAFSEDVFRYVYEGRLVWALGPGAPFAHPPAAAPTLGLPPALLDEAWLRINHPEISTIYPPFAQLVFAIAGGLGDLVGGGHLTFLRGLLVLADLGAWVLVARALRKQGRAAAESVVWGACPLVILEVAREGHADSLSALGLALGLYGFVAARPKLGYVGWALAALAKLNGLVVMPAAVRTTRRGLATGLALSALLVTPWLLAGADAGRGLGAYATRWRAGDGAFSLLLWLSEALLGGDWARIGGITVTQHQLARVLTAAVFGAAALALLARPAPKVRVPTRAGALLLLLLLLSPTLHPWYVIWVLPFAAAAERFGGRLAVLWLVAAAGALHHPGWLELVDGEWVDVGWVRALVHVPAWLLWGYGALRARAPDRAVAPRGG